MKFVARYLKKYKAQAILAPLLKMLEATFELLVPLVMANIIDRGIHNQDFAYIVKMSGVLVLLAVVGLGVSITAQYFSAKVAVNCSADIRRDMFVKIMSLSTGQQDKVGTDVLTTRITSDINQIQNTVNMVLRLFLRSPFIVLGATIMAFIVNPKCAIVFLIVVPVLSLIVYLVMKYTLPRYKQIQKSLEGVMKAVSENLEGVRVLRAFNCQDSEKDIFFGKTKDLADMQTTTGSVAALLNPVTYVVVNLGIVGLLLFSSKQVDAGTMLTGEVVAIVNYMSQILVELIKLANLIVLLMKAFPSAGRVEEIMNMANDERVHGKNANDADNFDIVFENVSFQYQDASEPAIENISFSIPEGSVFGIIGGTGSGKSTLLHLFYHDYDATEGKITLGGQNINEFEDSHISNIYGVVPQKATLFAGKVRENLSMKSHMDTSDETMREALRMACAYDFVMEKEGGLDAKVERNGRNFSGGQRQRLTIARGLMGDPRVIILDDSASALDLVTEAKLYKNLLGMKHKPTIIIVSQRASSVKKADQILCMEDGHVVGLGNHETLLKTCPTYEEIYYCQYPREGGSE
ncbi:MAG: ABC transporter ATP-binding protein [Pseudobutyrivibrio sp.]|nr:ABC transporter ATP-binding protein [Pseudobutyrivibrio sp.]